MNELPDEILAEKEQVEKTINILMEVLNRGNKTIVELAAIATFVHNCYNGIENILKQTLKKSNILIPQTQFWHKTLLQVGVKEKIISDSTANSLFNFLSFRHYFIHGYGHNLNESQLVQLAGELEKVWNLFLAEIRIVFNN